MADLRGRTALITGGSKGIGAASARALGGAGANVVVTARGEDALAAVVGEIEACDGEAMSVVADATDGASVERALDTLKQRYGGLDILVNNVGGAPKMAGFWDLDDADWLESYNLNVMGAVRFTRLAVPLLRESKTPRIINITSISALQPGTYNPHYAAAKAALLNLSKYLSNLLVEDGILVNSVCPGPVYSDSWDRNVERLAEERGITVDKCRAAVDREEAAKIPLKRIGEGRDVAGLVVFLASDEASWITGSCFHVDGGKTRSIL